MNPALSKLFRDGDPAAAEIDRFLAETPVPLVAGSDVTFLYRGSADAVFLRCWISGLDTAQPFQAMGETDLWAVTIELPKGSRIEYKIEVVTGDDRELIVDPLNPVLAHDPFGANSVCQGYGYERPEWTHVDPDARQGTIETHILESRHYGGHREFQVYVPARFRQNRR